MHVPFQRYTMRAEDGAPVFVDPTLFALALRMPLRECLEKGVRCASVGGVGAHRQSMGSGGVANSCEVAKASDR
jgi:hypothetical protein